MVMKKKKERKRKNIRKRAKRDDDIILLQVQVHGQVLPVHHLQVVVGHHRIK